MKIPIEREHFKFDVADWKFDYGFHVNAADGPRDLLGPCWEGAPSDDQRTAPLQDEAEELVAPRR